MGNPWHLYLMAAVYILAGANHFRNPKMYLRIIPTYIPFPKAANFISGFLELLLGAGLLVWGLTPFAAWGIIILLIAIFPANMFMLTDQRASFGLPTWILILRLPIQVLLILWAYIYT